MENEYQRMVKYQEAQEKWLEENKDKVVEDCIIDHNAYGLTETSLKGFFFNHCGNLLQLKEKDDGSGLHYFRKVEITDFLFRDKKEVEEEQKRLTIEYEQQKEEEKKEFEKKQKEKNKKA